MFSSPVQIVNFVISLLCSIVTIGYCVPQGLKTVLSRDTSALSKWYFIFSIVSSTLWISLGVFAICTPFIMQEYDGLSYSTKVAQGLNAGLASIITNTIGILIYVVILAIKISNQRKAKKLNMTEIDYCRQVLQTRKHKAEKL